MPSFVNDVNGNVPQYYLEITLSSNGGLDYQQQINMNSNTYSTYLASNISNLNFQDGGGNILTSWLESGETNTSTSSIYYIKMPNTTLVSFYAVFYNTNAISKDNAVTGCEPKYTATYAQYDNGANIFNFYDNFAGTALSTNYSSLNSGGSYSVNNGLTISVSNVTPSWIHIFTNTKYNPSIIETYVYSFSNSSVGEYGIAYTTITSASGGTDDWQTAYIFDTYSNTNRLIKYIGGSGSVIISNSYTLPINFMLTGIWNATGNEIEQINYSTQLTSTDNTITYATANLDLFVGNGGTADAVSFSIQYLRTRTYITSVPTTTYGTITSVSGAVNIQSNPNYVY